MCKKRVIFIVSPVLLLAFTVLLSINSFAQDKKVYKAPTFDRIFTKCSNPPFFGSDSEGVQTYLSEKLQPYLSNTEGEVRISLYVDTTGKSWCDWIENDSNLNLKKVKLNEVVDSMPNWNCGVQNGYKVTTVGVIAITFNRKDLKANYTIGRY